MSNEKMKEKQATIRFALIGFVVVGLWAFGAQASYGQWQGWAIRKVGKQVGKIVGKKIVHRGSEQTCLYGPFVCAKTAKAPSNSPPPRRPRNGSW